MYELQVGISAPFFLWPFFLLTFSNSVVGYSSTAISKRDLKMKKSFLKLSLNLNHRLLVRLANEEPSLTVLSFSFSKGQPDVPFSV